MRRAEQRVVGGDHPALDRHRDLEAAPPDQLQDPAQRLRAAVARQAVLHLGEADAALVGEDPVAAIEALALRHHLRRPLREPRDQRGAAAGQPQGQVAEGVLDHHVAGPGTQCAARARRIRGAVALDRQRGLGVREDEELEVVVGFGELVEAGDHLGQRPRRVDPVQGEGRDGAQRHRVDRAQRPDPDPGGEQLVPRAGAVQLPQLAVGGDQLDRLDLGGDVAQLRAGAMRAGRDRSGERLAVDVAEVLQRPPELVQALVEIGEPDPRLDLDQAGLGARRRGPCRGPRCEPSRRRSAPPR